MAKDPATLWYWNDWHGGTITFTRHLKGCYMDLLHAQFNSGRLSLEAIKTILGSDFGSWPSIQKKFEQDPQGLFYNEKLENEMNRRKEHAQRQRENVQKRWDKYHGNTTVDTLVIPLETETKTEIETKVKGGAGGNKFTPPTAAEVQAYFDEHKYDGGVEAFLYYDERGWVNKYKKPVKNWKSTMAKNWFKDDRKKKEIPQSKFSNNQW
jgi:hypothetical protein